MDRKLSSRRMFEDSLYKGFALLWLGGVLILLSIVLKISSIMISGIGDCNEIAFFALSLQSFSYAINTGLPADMYPVCVCSISLQPLLFVVLQR